MRNVRLILLLVLAPLLVQAAAITTPPVPTSAGSFTATLGGCTTAPTVSVKYVTVGKMVTLFFPVIASCTSNSTGLSYSGVPVALRAQTGTSFQTGPVVYCINNGVAEFNTCTAGVDTAGFINISRNGTGGFTNSGLKGIYAEFQFSYMKN